MKIRKFKQFSNGKYKVYLEDNSTISLYEDVIINNNLLLTKDIDDSLIMKLTKENDYYHCYSVSINYLSIRMRSIKEMTEYLKKKNFNNSIINKTIKRLTNEGYLNDFNYAKAYANDKFNLTQWGPQKIKLELVKNGVSNEISTNIIEDINAQLVREKLSNLMKKQIKLKKNLSGSALKLTLLNYFVNLGYKKEMVLEEFSNFNLIPDFNYLKKEYNKLKNKYVKKYDNEKLEWFVCQKLYAKGFSKEDIDNIKQEDLESVNKIV